MTEPTAAGPSDITVADYLRDNHPQVLARLRRQQCPVCGRAMRHVATDHLTRGGHTPPVFRCAEPGPDHFHPDYRGPDLTWGYWSTNGVQVAWYRTLDPQWTPWLLWEQKTPDDQGLPAPDAPASADAEQPPEPTARISVWVERSDGSVFLLIYHRVAGLNVANERITHMEPDRPINLGGGITGVEPGRAILDGIDFTITGHGLPDDDGRIRHMEVVTPPRPAPSPEALARVEAWLRGFTRPDRAPWPSTQDIFARSCELLIALGASCDPDHIGPFLGPPGLSDEPWKCLACGQPEPEATAGGRRARQQP